MRAFILFSCLAMAAAMARPEFPAQYSNLQQQNQRGLSQNVNAVQRHAYRQLHSTLGFTGNAAPTHTYSGPKYLPFSDTRNEVVTPELTVQGDSYSAAHRHSSSTQHQSGYANGPAETHVHKHIYVHVPPKDFEEEEAAPPRVTQQMGPKQKHYKIVFIKAPSAPAMRAPVVAPAPQHEEKTLIYVLHKKAESHSDIVIPAPAPTTPSKPEVFFIKYKTKKEEAPVYGPPPATRQAAAASGEYNTPLSNDINNFVPMDQSQYEQQVGTAQPAVAEAQHQFMNVGQAPESYSAPTMSGFLGNEVQTTAGAPNNQYLAPEPTSQYLAPEPNNQYLAPEANNQYLAPEVTSAEMQHQRHVPFPSYGPPNHFFLKRRK